MPDWDLWDGWGHGSLFPDWTQIQIGARLGKPDWCQIAFARPVYAQIRIQKVIKNQSDFTSNFDGFWAAQGDLLGLHMVGFYTSLCGATWWHPVLIGVIFVDLWSIRLVSRFEFVPFLSHFG